MTAVFLPLESPPIGVYSDFNILKPKTIVINSLNENRFLNDDYIYFDRSVQGLLVITSKNKLKTNFTRSVNVTYIT